jgi:hypothetical protein
MGEQAYKAFPTRRGAGHFALVCLTLVTLVFPSPARAWCVCCTDLCWLAPHIVLDQLVEQQNQQLEQTIYDEFQKHQTWLINDFFFDYIQPAMMKMTGQLSTTGMNQVAAIGAIMDAKHQLEVQRLLQDLSAQAHKDYQPSHEMCVIGTAARGLSSASRNVQNNAFLMAQRSIDRQLGHVNTSAAEGSAEDRENRVAQFKRLYCDVSDNNNGLGTMCKDAAGTPQSGPPGRINKDVDYARTIGNAMTLAVDFSDAVMSAEDEDFLALSSNLFAHEVFGRLTDPIIGVLGNQDEYLTARSVVAKRSVIENSFYNIAAMKSAGTAITDATGPAPATGDYAAFVLQQLGVPAQEAQLMVGDRPSYYALLEILAQKIYQDPDFFTNLYDKPANVARKDVAMQAIDLVVDRDIFKSELRTEAMMALWLEMEVLDWQKGVQNRLNSLQSGGREN